MYRALKPSATTIPTTQMVEMYSFLLENPSCFKVSTAITLKATDARASRVLYPSRNPAPNAEA